MFIFTFFLHLFIYSGASLPWPVTSSMAQNGSEIILDFCNFEKPVGIIKYNHPEKPGIVFVDFVCQIDSMQFINQLDWNALGVLGSLGCPLAE